MNEAEPSGPVAEVCSDTPTDRLESKEDQRRYSLVDTRWNRTCLPLVLIPFCFVLTMVVFVLPRAVPYVRVLRRGHNLPLPIVALVFSSRSLKLHLVS
jgi:hypothetical protein